MNPAKSQESHEGNMLPLILEHRDILRGMDRRLELIEGHNTRIIDLLEKKVDELIGALKGKDMMPVATFKWLVGFVIAFSFITFFGFATAQYFMDRITGSAVSATSIK